MRPQREAAQRRGRGEARLSAPLGRRDYRRLALVFVALITLSACAQITPTVPTPTAASPTLPPTAVPTIAATSTASARTVGTTPPATPLTLPATATRSASATPGGTTTCAPGVELLGFSDALDKVTFADTRVGGLSALVYDATRDRYLALVDNDGDSPARVYTLRIPVTDGRLGTPTIEAVTTLRDEAGVAFTGRTLDGEGLTLLPGGDLLVASETEPSIRRFAPDGHQRGTLAVPPRFLVKPAGEAPANQAFESLALVPDGSALYTAPEGPLAPDGFAAPVRARLRLLRYSDGPAFAPSAQYFYLAEAAQGLSEIAALGLDDLLALERGFIPGLGNTVRLFRVALAGQPDVSARASLADPDLTPLPKTLVVDLGLCPPGAATHPGRQANPLLDNIESVALGPRLPDGRRSLILLSDDNFAADQVTRVYLLAFGP